MASPYGRVIGWLANTLLVLFGVSVLAFVLTYLTPGDLAENMLTSQGVQPTAEMISLMRERLGLDRPLWEQYLSWLGRLLHGDLGTSLSNGTNIMTDLQRRLPLTLALTVASLVLTWLIAIPVGITAALRPRGLSTSWSVSLATSAPRSRDSCSRCWSCTCWAWNCGGSRSRLPGTRTAW